MKEQMEDPGSLTMETLDGGEDSQHWGATSGERSSRHLVEISYDFSVETELVGPVQARVVRVMQHAVYFMFHLENKEQFSIMTPGHMYVNGSDNLLNTARSINITKEIFQINTEFNIMVKKLKESFKARVDNDKEVNENGTSRKRKAQQESKDVKPRIVDWGVTLLYQGSQPDTSNLQSTDLDTRPHTAAWEQLSNKIQSKLLNNTGDKTKTTEEQGDHELVVNSWFLTHISGLNPSNIPAIYPQTDKKLVKGKVIEIHKPFGGIVEVAAEEGGRLKFHRRVVVADGQRVLDSDVLEDMSLVGETAMVEIIDNKDAEGNALLQDAGDKIASGVFIGSSKVEEENPELESYGQLCHKVRVVELYYDEVTGMVTRMLGCIQPGPFISKGKASASMVGEFVNITRETLYFYGVKIKADVDLAHLYSVGDDVMCVVKMLDTKEGRAQFECKIGWSDSWIPTLRLTIPASCPQMMKLCVRKGLDWSRLERIIDGRYGARSQMVADGMVRGTVIELEPAENNETVRRGKIRVEGGEHRGKVVRFNRSKATLFGMKLDIADLLYIVRPFDLVYCEVSGITDYPDTEYMSQRVSFHAPARDKQVTSPMTDLDQEERLDFLFWLSIHYNTFSLLQSVLAGKAPTRYFIPFPSDALLGRVVCFDPPKNTRNSFGCTSGTIVIDSGFLNLDINEVGEGESGMRDMTEVKVTFHRSCFWIYGRKMAKADLSYVIQPNQKVMVECKKITDEARAQFPNLPQDMDYRATVIWIGPSRPRNDWDDPSRNDPGIFPWLGKRGLNIGQFQKLIEGKVPGNIPAALDHNGFFLPPVRGEGASMSSMEMMMRNQPVPEQLPVLRHGPVITHILDSAISCSGPSDPRLFTLLENDEMAQAAHHVSEALRYAIQYYKEATAGMRQGFGMGYGPAGPQGAGGAAGPHQRSYEWGGGYHRPHKHPKY